MIPSFPVPATSYTTSPDSSTLLGRLFPSATFYTKLFCFVIAQGHAAKQGRYPGAAWAYGSYQVLRALEESGVTFHVEGIENFTHLQGSCVFIANHMSTLETTVLPCLIQPHKETTFITKKELVDYPIFGPILQSRRPIVVGRKKPREDLVAVLHEGTERLAQGTSIVVFPQSTRQVTFSPDQFNSIGIKLAKKAGVPVVPVALRTDAWGIGNKIKECGKIDPKIPVHIRFGTPLHIAETGKQEHQIVCDFIQDSLLTWKNTA